MAVCRIRAILERAEARAEELGGSVKPFVQKQAGGDPRAPVKRWTERGRSACRFARLCGEAPR